MKRRIGVCTLSVFVVAALTGSASGGRLKFSGNLCTTVSVAALNVTAPCVNEKPHVAIRSTPLGSVRTVRYTAHWGQAGTVGHPRAYFTVQATQTQGSAAAVAHTRKALRAAVLSGGLLFLNGGGRMGSTSVETVACANAPIDDCNQAEIWGLVGQWGVIGVYGAPAPFIAADDPNDHSVDEANDLAQEDAIRKPLVAAGKAVITALG